MLASLTEWVEGTELLPPLWINGDWKAVINLVLLDLVRDVREYVKNSFCCCGSRLRSASLFIRWLCLLQYICIKNSIPIELKVFHRKCFICSECGKSLHRFSYRDQMETLMCYKHSPHFCSRRNLPKTSYVY
uniref:LIM zinc-binding domain-containing protein n=1 Tax=Onchocerca volvulus TaxID=6282 RepID=A0A8R1TVA4_ONCVO